MTVTTVDRRASVGTRRRSRTPSRTAQDVGRALATTTMLLVVVLSLIGSVMVLSASSVVALSADGNSFAIFARQAIWLLLGLATLTVSARIDYRRWRGWVLPLLGVTYLLLLLVLVPSVGRSVNGSRRWIGTDAFQIQPAEPAKLALIVFLAALLSHHWNRPDSSRITLRPALAVGGGYAALLMMQPNLGTTLVVTAVVGVMLFWSGTPMRPLLLIGAVGVAGATYLALSADYRRERVLSFLHPWENAGDSSYQMIQSLIGVASGGVTGTGLGASRAKWGFLPEAHTDFVFSIIGEELGLLGSLLVVALFAGLIACAVRISSWAPDPFAALLAIGIAAWFSVQAFINVGATIGLLPITGVPLPFVSFGGSSLLTTMAAAGILLNIARHATLATSSEGRAERRIDRTARRRSGRRGGRVRDAAARRDRIDRVLRNEGLGGDRPRPGAQGPGSVDDEAVVVLLDDDRRRLRRPARPAP